MKYLTLLLLFLISMWLGGWEVAPPAKAQLFNGPVDRLPVLERVALREGKVLVTGENGRYQGRVLVKAEPTIVWSVLTDYNNFTQFLPNIISSRILDTQGNRKIVEQISQQQIFVITVQARIRYQSIENAPDRIEFRLLEGDLSRLDGFWQLEPVAPYGGAKPDQILITHSVEAEPAEGTSRDIFQGIFRNSLADTLQAVQQEIQRRTSKI